MTGLLRCSTASQPSLLSQTKSNNNAIQRHESSSFFNFFIFYQYFEEDCRRLLWSIFEARASAFSSSVLSFNRAICFLPQNQTIKHSAKHYSSRWTVPIRCKMTQCLTSAVHTKRPSSKHDQRPYSKKTRRLSCKSQSIFNQSE